MKTLILKLKKNCSFLDSWWCNLLIGLVVFLNPIAMLPQVLVAFTGTTEQVTGISISTFLLFSAIQLAVATSAVKAVDWKLFCSMAISFFQSLIIVAVVIIRT